MTLPNGAGGVTGGWPFLTSADGHGDNPISGLLGNDQDFVVNIFKEKFIGEFGSGTSVFTSGTGPLAQVFGGLRSGIPLPLAIIEAIIKKFLPFDLGDFSNVTDALAGLEDASTNLFNLLGFDPTASGFNPSAVWTQIIGTFINPLGLLAPLNSSGFLPNANRPQLVQDILDAGKDVFTTGIQGSSTNTTLPGFFGGLLGIFGTGSNAQSQNVVQDSQISQLLTGSGAVGLSDTFDGAAGALNSTNWDQTYFGSGSGSDGLNGSGKCAWTTSGAVVRGSLNRYKTSTTSDTQLVQVTTTSSVGFSTIGSHPSFRIQGRMNATNDDYVEARISYGSAEIGYVIAGVYHLLGSAVTGIDTSSGTWTLKLGTTVSSREFVLLKNGSTIISQTDGGAASPLDASHRYTGFSHVAGVQFFYIFYQFAPPDLESFGAADRLAAL